MWLEAPCSGTTAIFMLHNVIFESQKSMTCSCYTIHERNLVYRDSIPLIIASSVSFPYGIVPLWGFTFHIQRRANKQASL